MIDISLADRRPLAVRLDASTIVRRTSLVVLIAHTVAALALGLNTYADGAWFDFALLTGEPYRLVWHNYPLRQTHYWLVYAPALAVLKLHGPRWLVLFTAHAIWNLVPLASLGACRAVAPKASLTAPAAFFAIFGLLTWGFPTEAILLAALVWPAFYVVSFGRTRLQLAAGAAALVACGLTYEAWIAFAPLLLLAAALRQDAKGAVASVLIGVVGGALAAIIAVSLIRPSEATHAELAVNAGHLLGTRVFGYPAVWKQSCIALVMVSVLALSRLSTKAANPLLAAGSAICLFAALAPIDGYPFGRYDARTVLLGALWLALMALILRERFAAAIKAPAAFQAATALLLLLAVTAENTRFGMAWLTYQSRIREAATCRPTACGQVAEFGWSHDTALVEWAWGLPFRSWILAKDQRQMNILAEPARTRWPSQLSCDDAGRLKRMDEARYKLFTAVCRPH